MTLTINPKDINLDSEFNERVDVPEDQELLESIKLYGIQIPPTVRKVDDEYEVVTGKRRVTAAVQLDMEEIEVIVVDGNDFDSLRQSITENHFRKSVTPMERVNALTKLWEMHCEEENEESPLRPSVTGIHNITGISTSTIHQWLEATKTDWEGTVIEKELDGASETDFYNQLGEGKVSALRRGIDKSPETWTTDDIDELVEWAAEAELTVTQCREAEGLIAKGADTQTAMEAVTNDLVEETHKALDEGEADKTINAEPAVENLDISLDDEEETEDEEDGFETIELSDEERETQWLDEVQGAEEKFSGTPVPQEDTEEDDVSEFEIAFTIDDPHMVASVKAAMEQLGYDDPQQVVDLALERLLSMMEKEIQQ